MRLHTKRQWRRQPVTCCACGDPLEVVRHDLALVAGAGFMPNVPGAICERCLPVAEGPVVPMLLDDATDTMLRTAAFELETPDAVQVFLDHWGWQHLVISGAAMRLHLDGYGRDAHGLLEAAGRGNRGRKPWFMVEQASLRILDGEVGQALDLLEATGEGDHPCWNLHHGLLAQSIGRKEAALEHWRRQVEVEPEEPLGWKLLSWYYMQESEDFEAAEQLMRQACERFPRWMEFRAWLGNALYRQERHQEALTELEASRFLDPIDEEFREQVNEFIEQVRGHLQGDS